MHVWFLYFLSLSISEHLQELPLPPANVFSPTMQSQVEQVTGVPVTSLISKTKEHGRVDLNYIPAVFLW